MALKDKPRRSASPWEGMAVNPEPPMCNPEPPAKKKESPAKGVRKAGGMGLDWITGVELEQE